MDYMFIIQSISGIELYNVDSIKVDEFILYNVSDEPLRAIVFLN
jgi:hypothetical protein